MYTAVKETNIESSLAYKCCRVSVHILQSELDPSLVKSTQDIHSYQEHCPLTRSYIRSGTRGLAAMIVWLSTGMKPKQEV